MRLKNYYLLIVLISFISCNTEKQNKNSEPKRPNIVLIMADDMGFSDIGSYGGEVETPNLDALADGGLRYTQFYNNARCVPTRASLMTGVYPHQAGLGWMTAADLGTPAYQGELNNETVTIAEVLQTADYDTYMTGKWHLSRGRNIRAGIKDNWPSQRGFDRYFGIVGGASNYFTPAVYSDNEKYKAPGAGEDFYFTHAVSDSTVMFMDKHFGAENKKENPMFMYVAYTAPHWPLHALEEDISKYERMYNIGWDRLRAQRFERQKELGIFDSSAELSERDAEVPAWDEMSKEEQEAFAKRMAIYSAQIDAMDQGIGRIVNKLDELGELDNTIIMFLSDNGACAEYISGGPSREITGQANTWESYRINWANAGSTPYREYKHWIHEGGIATPMIVHWPDGIDKDLNGGFIREPGHIMDIMATALDVSGAQYPTQYKGNEIHPLEGKSLLPHFSGNKTDREPIYWEHEGNIGLRDGKWKLVAKTEENADFDPSNLELYDMEADPVELNNLADQQPERLNEMYEAWKKWAEKVNVVIDTREYNMRARAYQRVINGDFNNQFAGWQLKGKNIADFSIDDNGQISGDASAKISILHPGEIAMEWPFFAEKDEKFDISFSAKASEDLLLKVVFEPRSGEPLYEQEIKIDQNTQTHNFQTSRTERNGQYRLAFYILNNEGGGNVWIDNVHLEESSN